MSMEFTVQFYETAAGVCPVRDFLDELKSSDPDDFAAVVAGLAKLRNRGYTGNLYARRLAKGYSSCGTLASLTRACSGFL